MSRKNTIIIAVLINVGLLVVLFSTAMKSDSSGTEMAAQHEKTGQARNEIQLPRESNPIPQFQNQEKELSSAIAQQPATPSSAITEQSNDAAKMDFIADLNALAGAEIQETALPATLPQDTKEGSPNLVEVVVKKGDVLEKIARLHNTTVDDIMKRNHLTTSRLNIGQVLKVMPKNEKKNSAAPNEKKENTALFYTVKNGDNPWTIAVKNHMKVEELLKLNNLNEEKARRLKPGDQLRIR